MATTLWGISPWGATLWGLAPEFVTPPLRVQRPILPGVSATIDGQPVELSAPRWSADLRGYKNASGFLTGKDARRVQQGSILKIYTDDGQTRWEGRLDRNPLVIEGVAEIQATGYQAEAENAAGRLLYQTRDYGLWQDAEDPPHEIGGYKHQDIETDVKASALKFMIPKAEDVVSGAEHGVVLWAPGTPGLITRVAGRYIAQNTGNTELGLRRFTGPSGAVSSAAGALLAGPNPFNQVLGVPEDGVMLALRTTAALAPSGAKKVVRIVDLRVNGIWGTTGRDANADIMRADEAVADIATRLGWDTRGITQSTLNVLPLDHIDGPHSDLLDYVAMLTDRYCRVLDNRGSGPYSEFAPFGTREWTVLLSDGSTADVVPAELFNKVVVKYETVKGKPRQSVATADPNPLTGYTRTKYFELSDPQADSTLADTVRDILLTQYSTPTVEGHVSFIIARNSAGVSDPYSVLPGDTMRIADYGPAESMSVRIHEVEFTDTECRAGLEMPVTVEGELARVALVAARKPFKKSGKGKGK